MTREEAIKVLNGKTRTKIVNKLETREWFKFREALEMAIQALSQEPCDDAVSREDALNSLIENTDFEGWELSQALEAIEKLPSVTQKSGMWVLLDECANSGYYCSNCQKKLVKEGWSNTVKKVKYCPNCGCRMESEVSNDIRKWRIT